MTSFEDIKTTLYAPPSARGPKPVRREVPRWQFDPRLAEALRIIKAPSTFVLQTVAIVLLLRWTWGDANHPSHAAVPAHAESVTPGRVESHEPPRTPPVTLPAVPSRGPAAPQVPMIVPQVLAAPQVLAMPQVSVVESQMPFTPQVPVVAPQVPQMPASPVWAPVGLIPASVGEGSATAVGSASNSPQPAVPAAGAIAEATPRVQAPSRKASGKRAAASHSGLTGMLGISHGPDAMPARLTIDGRSYGYTPVVTEVAAGQHRVRLVWADGQVFERVVSVKAGDYIKSIGLELSAGHEPPKTRAPLPQHP